MASHVNVRNYRLQQAPLRTGRKETPSLKALFSMEEQKTIGIVAAVILVLGLTFTQFFHGQIVDSKAKVQQLQSKNSAIANENIRLLATRAQLASKASIVSHAKVKLNLFEPEKGQVHRM